MLNRNSVLFEKGRLGRVINPIYDLPIQLLTFETHMCFKLEHTLEPPGQILTDLVHVQDAIQLSSGLSQGVGRRALGSSSGKFLATG